MFDRILAACVGTNTISYSGHKWLSNASGVLQTSIFLNYYLSFLSDLADNGLQNNRRRINSG